MPEVNALTLVTKVWPPGISGFTDRARHGVTLVFQAGSDRDHEVSHFLRHAATQIERF